MNTAQLLSRTLLALVAVALVAAAQDSSIVGTSHNLAISGPGPYKSITQEQICIFCHTPHRARSTAPLWNREDSRESYLPYTSSTFGGTPGQPTGGSKLCLSCHDGSIALGSVLSLNTEIEMASGFRFLQSGQAFIGTNLMDDHPISFNYATSDGGSGQEYVAAASIPLPVHLDEMGNLECTSCHDAHDNSLGNFLLASDRFSALCLSCHAPDEWPSASHNLSGAVWDGSGPDPWPNANYTSVAENGCQNCHSPHLAAHPERLLTFATDEDNCLACHAGHVASTDIDADLNKPYRHDVFATFDVHDPVEDALSMTRHVECQDCHNPHAARPGAAAPPGVPGANLLVGGLDASGQPVDAISFGYELCFKCHADNNAAVAHVPRQVLQTNVRLEFDPSNPSFHPVEARGVSNDVPSLKPPYTTASIISCGDCHQSNSSPDFGGTGPAGPHGSIYSPLLGANYDRTDNLPETAQRYALCYTCHSRENILDDRSFKRHEDHIVDEKIACSACHDPHGISASQGSSSSNSHLINFDLSLVSPSPTTGQLFFRDDGDQEGTCSLLCHGEDHDPFDY